VNSLDFEPPVQTDGIEIRKVTNPRLKPAALKLEEYKRKASEHRKVVSDKEASGKAGASLLWNR